MDKDIEVWLDSAASDIENGTDLVTLDRAANLMRRAAREMSRLRSSRNEIIELCARVADREAETAQSRGALSISQEYTSPLRVASSIRQLKEPHHGGVRGAEAVKPALYEPCSVRDGKFVEPCSTLLSVIGATIQHVHWTNFKTMEPSLSFFVIKSGEHKKAGIILNRCPFCGENIGEPIERRQQIKPDHPPVTPASEAPASADTEQSNSTDEGLAT